MTKQDRINAAHARVREQVLWIAEHGSNRAGYVARYGSSSAPLAERQGDGGERIYEADEAELAKRRRELADLTRLTTDAARDLTNGR